MALDGRVACIEECPHSAKVRDFSQEVSFAAIDNSEVANERLQWSTKQQPGEDLRRRSICHLVDGVEAGVGYDHLCHVASIPRPDLFVPLRTRRPSILDWVVNIALDV